MIDHPQLTVQQASRRAQMDALLKTFSTDQQVHHQEWSELQGPIPSRLYHYTTIDGLVGITSTGSLWASDARFMNDSSELSYAIGLIKEIIDEVFSGVKDEALKKLLSNSSGHAKTFANAERPFIACFCEIDDLLSQWRGYGTDKAPVSLGLDLRATSLPKRTFLRKVIYDPEEQRRLVRAVVEIWLGTIKTLLNRNDSIWPSEVPPSLAVSALQGALAEHHLCFKHPTFSEEKEWRLIKLMDVRGLLGNRQSEEFFAAAHQTIQEADVDMLEDNPTWAELEETLAAAPQTMQESDVDEGIEVKFRRSPLGLVPYVELLLRDGAGVFTGRLPLRDVVQGPTPHPDLSVESLRMFLESQGYGFYTQTKFSGVPLRR